MAAGLAMLQSIAANGHRWGGTGSVGGGAGRFAPYAVSAGADGTTGTSVRSRSIGGGALRASLASSGEGMVVTRRFGDGGGGGGAGGGAIGRDDEAIAS